MVKRPRQVKVSPYAVYSIGWVRNLTFYHENAWGAMDAGTRKIEVNLSYKAEEDRRVTLAHEIAHAMMFDAGFAMHEEQQAEVLGRALIYFLRNNPNVVDYLRG